MKNYIRYMYRQIQTCFEDIFSKFRFAKLWCTALRYNADRRMAKICGQWWCFSPISQKHLTVCVMNLFPSNICLFKVSNKNTRTTSLKFLLLTLNMFHFFSHFFSSVSIAGFEQVIVNSNYLAWCPQVWHGFFMTNLRLFHW